MQSYQINRLDIPLAPYLNPHPATSIEPQEKPIEEPLEELSEADLQGSTEINPSLTPFRILFRSNCRSS
jgi:hypothetical protein